MLQPNDSVGSPIPNENKPSRLPIKRTKLLYIPAILLIFAFGWGFGKGNIKFGKSSSPSNSSNLTKDLDFVAVQKVYDTLKANYDGTLDSGKLSEGMKEGLARAVGDPYTEYFTTEKEKNFKNDLNGTFSGIGAELSKDGDNLIVQSPISGAPAEKAGVRARDIIAEINGESTSGVSVDDAVKKIRGEKGTIVKLTLLRNATERVDVAIVRDQITIPSVTTKILDGNVGYMQVSRFAEDTAGLASKAATEFKDKKVTGIILDLRNDPGGYLDSAVSLAGQWMDSGAVVVDERRGDVVTHSYKSSGPAILKGIPTAILINGGSASASEITAGALRDAAAGTLIGEKSFGKGVVQEIKELGGSSLLGSPNTEGALKVTVAKWFTPKGLNIHKEGLKPDIEQKLSETDIKSGNDSQLKKAQEWLAGKR